MRPACRISRQAVPRCRSGQPNCCVPGESPRKRHKPRKGGRWKSSPGVELGYSVMLLVASQNTLIALQAKNISHHLPCTTFSTPFFFSSTLQIKQKWRTHRYCSEASSSNIPAGSSTMSFELRSLLFAAFVVDNRHMPRKGG